MKFFDDHNKRKKKIYLRVKGLRKGIAGLIPKMGYPAHSSEFSTIQFDITLPFKIILPSGQQVSSNGEKIPIKIFRPTTNEEGPLPTLLHIPASAFIVLIPEFSDITCSQLAVKSGCQVVVINHRVAPEHPFPTPLADCYFILKYLLQKKIANEFRIDLQKVALSGYSAGATFSALLSYLVKNTDVKIAHQFLIAPVTDLTRTLKRFKDFEKADKRVKDEFIQSAIEAYVEPHFRSHPYCSPYWQTDHRNLPPTDGIYGEIDRLRSDSEMYFSQLKKAGNEVYSTVFKNEDHAGFWYNITMIELIAARLQMIFNLLPIPRLLPMERLLKKPISIELSKSNNSSEYEKLVISLISNQSLYKFKCEKISSQKPTENINEDHNHEFKR